MKHDIDLFWPFAQNDLRFDVDRNAKLLNIVFAGGTFGNFLKFFIDKFSTLSPNIEGDPFTSIGTSHELDKNGFDMQASKTIFSGLVQRYHPTFINDNVGQTDLPICIPCPSKKKHFLYLKKGQLFRSSDAMDSPDDLWRKAVGEMPFMLKHHVSSIIKLYDIKNIAHFSWIPKFIVRDWYKLEFLNELEDTFDFQWFEELKSHDFFKKQKVFHLDLETFFNWETFLKNITELDVVFGLALDFDRHTEMKALFDKGLRLDIVRNEANLVESVMEKGEDTSFDHLDVSSEAFIYAETEKSNDFIQMPLTNRFFRDTAELKQFVEHYPNYYKAMNPNMPEFNGIANPYYLKKDK